MSLTTSDVLILFLFPHLSCFFIHHTTHNFFILYLQLKASLGHMVNTCCQKLLYFQDARTSITILMMLKLHNKAAPLCHFYRICYLSKPNVCFSFLSLLNLLCLGHRHRCIKDQGSFFALILSTYQSPSRLLVIEIMCFQKSQKHGCHLT